MGNIVIIDTNLLRRRSYNFDLVVDVRVYYVTYLSYFELMVSLKREQVSDEEKNYINYIFELIRKQRIRVLKPKKNTDFLYEYLNFSMIDSSNIEALPYFKDVVSTVPQLISVILLYVEVGIANSVAVAPNTKEYIKFKKNVTSKYQYDDILFRIKKIIYNGYKENILIRKSIHMFFNNEIQKVIEQFSNTEVISSNINYNYGNNLNKLFKKENLLIGNDIKNDFIYNYCFEYAEAILNNNKKFQYNDMIDCLNIYYAYKLNYKYMTNDEQSLKLIKKYLKKVESCKNFINNNIIYI